ncbi:dienelactone hydrolase family protein, partial [Roseateles sp.]|uniref:dienelactone hydrolase family protein n=1 Tax=Roseateles sp. TaxID=1971397 RepID=UPI00392642D7
MMRRRQFSLLPAALLSTPAFASLDDSLQRLQQQWRPRLAWRADPSWRAEALASARRHILQPGDDGAGFDTEVLAEETRTGGVLAQSLRLRVAAGEHAPALFLRPAGPGPHPAVLLLHDHGARFDIGKEKLIAPMAGSAQREAATAWAERYFDGVFLGDWLAAQGYAVLAVDALGWGGRARAGFARDDQQALAAHLQQLGLSWAGLIASDDLRSLRWLRAQDGVDRHRVAVLGFSMGAFRAWQLAAVAEPHEVQACIAAHWMCTREGLLRPGGNALAGQSAFTMLHPGLAAELDHPDVAALIAPRPLLLMASPEDKLFPWDAAQTAAQQLARAWPRGEG